MLRQRYCASVLVFIIYALADRQGMHLPTPITSGKRSAVGYCQPTRAVLFRLFNSIIHGCIPATAVATLFRSSLESAGAADTSVCGPDRLVS